MEIMKADLDALMINRGIDAISDMYDETDLLIDDLTDYDNFEGDEDKQKDERLESAS